MKRRYSLVSAMVMVASVVLLTACGGTGKSPQSASIAIVTGTKVPAVVVPTHPPSKQEITNSKTCLEKERVRPARHTPYRPQVPHGANEVTRNGLPMTPSEYEATVRRCVARTRSASASTHRK